MLAVLIGLGVWQLERLEWKTALIAQRESRGAQPAIALPERLEAAEELEFQTVRAVGRYLHDRELYLAARSFKSRPGLHVVTPFALDDGRVLLVDRGWVPEDRRDPATRPEGQVSGLQTVTGLLRRPGWHGSAWLRPDNEPGKNVWLWVDPAAMAAAAGLGPQDGALIDEVYLAAGPEDLPGGLPMGGATAPALVNNHLQYALTWFALAVGLAVIYLLYHLRRDPEGDAP